MFFRVSESFLVGRKGYLSNNIQESFLTNLLVEQLIGHGVARIFNGK